LTSSGRNWVSNPLPSREQALALLRANHCSPQVMAHCKAVAKLAVETAKTLQERGFSIDVDLVEVGALLHDIGRSKTHSVNHVVAGAEIAQAVGMPEAVICIIKRHVGGGITSGEAKELGWPDDNYLPITLEEKVVSYADKLVETTDERVSIEETINKFHARGLSASAERVRKIHDEIAQMCGEKP
jgi:uncharacterized protein